MKRREFKEELFALLENSVEGMSFEEKIQYVEKILIDFQREHEDERDTSNKGKPWRDEDLKIILSDAATASNCMEYAILYRRGYGSIEQIYRWATTPKHSVNQKRPEDKFVLQIKRIVRELGLRG